ncbi:MAG: FAD-dependent oxidoreductase [Burkholderiaceae bacterium]
MSPSDSDAIVIVGGGHAAAQLCGGLAAAGLGARVHLVCEEAEPPYQRPPLSKAYLKNPQEGLQLHRDAAAYGEAGITLHRADPVIAIDRGGRTVGLQSGLELAYGQLVLATGARPRRLPHLSADLANIASLRSAADAQRLRDLLIASTQVTVLGGGFIGLEIAAVARGLGKSVTVLESAPRLLMRSVSAEIAEHVLQTHRRAGIEIRLGVAVGTFDIVDDRLRSVHVDGLSESVDLLVLGIGSLPETELARVAGLACENGIAVDEHMRTSDPAILAIGDCTSFPEPTSGRRLRLESVQNANDQARAALATLLGKPQPYRALPWFWSDQGGLRLQIAGLLPPQASAHRRPGPTPASFSVLHYVGERLACVESVNAPLDHISARKLIETGRSPAPALACDPSIALKSHA